jgi:hypothetical protein
LIELASSWFTPSLMGCGADDQVLGLLEAEAGDGADDLDHLDLLGARVREDDVEGRLLLGGGTAVAGGCGGTGGGDRDRSGGRDAPLLLDLVLQLDELEDRHAPELLEDRVNCCHRCFLLGCQSAETDWLVGRLW